MNSLKRLIFILLQLKLSLAFGIWPIDAIQNAFKDDPEYLVKIQSEYKGNTIVGTGYIVQIKDRLYVRTASHVTLGGKAKIKIIAMNGEHEDEELEQDGDWITNSLYDDQLIGLKSKTLTPLGIFLPTSKVYVVNPDLDFKPKELNTQNIQIGAGNTFFIVPSWSPRSNNDFHSQKIAVPGFVDYNLRSGMAFNKNDSFINSDLKIIPGESGTPLIGYTSGYVLMDAKRFVDKSILNAYGETPVIFGHALSYMYDFTISTFLSPYRSADLPEALEKGLNKIDLYNVEWHYLNLPNHKSMFYRSMKMVTENGSETVQEINFTSSVAGDGTKGDGGDITIANAGDGTKGDGGDITTGNVGDGTKGDGGSFSEDAKNNSTTAKTSALTTSGKMITSGMMINSQQVLAFSVKYKNTYESETVSVYGNWDTYFALKNDSQVESIKVITPEQSITDLIKEKINRNSENLPDRGRPCLIDMNKLKNNILSLRTADIHFQNQSEQIEIPLTNAKERSQFSPIIDGSLVDNGANIYSRETGKIKIDLRGLFATDYSFSKIFDNTNMNSQFNFYSQIPYLVLSLPNGKYQYLRCYGKY